MKNVNENDSQQQEQQQREKEIKKKKKSGKKSKIKSKSTSDKNNTTAATNIQDERFAFAQTFPQFQNKFSVKKKKEDRERTKNNNLTATGSSSGDLLLQVGNDDPIGSDEKKVDERFASIYTDDRFAIGGDFNSNSKANVDQYGRKIKKKKNKMNTDKTGKDMDKVVVQKEEIVEKEDDYDDDNDDDNDNVKEMVDKDDKKKPSKIMEVDSESRISFLTALSRGEISASSSSDDDSSSDESNNANDDSSVEDDIHGKAGIFDPSYDDKSNIELTLESSPYLVVCNIDWVNLRAVDILSIVSSFASSGSVQWVKIFPSDFGLKQMSKEEVMGPAGIWKKVRSSNVVLEEIDATEPESDDDNDDSDDHDLSNNDDDNDNYDENSLGNDDAYSHFHQTTNTNETNDFGGYNPEKLRAYEASKLKYYFAMVQFTSPAAADAVYKELDGMEIGHSSAIIDLRTIPPQDFDTVTQGRDIIDEASLIPSNYVPPDFVVTALQQTAVKCTWEEGDSERDRVLTQYGVGNEAWNAMTEGDDLKAYLASDASSEEEEHSADDEGSNNEENDYSNGKEKSKGSQMRKLLGLDNDDHSSSSNDENNNANDEDDSNSDSSSVGFFSKGTNNNTTTFTEEENEEEDDQVAKYIPGRRVLEDKIRSKLLVAAKQSGGGEEDEEKEPSPWEKYQAKKKKKRQEKRKELRDKKAGNKKSNNLKEKTKKESNDSGESDTAARKGPISKEELDLLLAGDNGKFLYSIILYF